MITFPQTALYKTRITFSRAEGMWNSVYKNPTENTRSLYGKFNKESGNFSRSSLAGTGKDYLYDLISNYYADCEIGYDDINTFVRRFNSIFDLQYERFNAVLKDNHLQIGTTENEHRYVEDDNTLNNGYTENYQRTGNNTTTSKNEGSSQNAVTQLTKDKGENTNTTIYGEGYDITRSRDGKTDERRTTTNFNKTIIEFNDVLKYLETDFVTKWIDGFHSLFMEVL